MVFDLEKKLYKSTQQNELIQICGLWPFDFSGWGLGSSKVVCHIKSCGLVLFSFQLLPPGMSEYSHLFDWGHVLHVGHVSCVIKNCGQ